METTSLSIGMRTWATSWRRNEKAGSSLIQNPLSVIAHLMPVTCSWTDWGQTPTSTAADKLVGKLALGLGVDQRSVRSWAMLRAVENALWALDVRASPAADLAKAAALNA